MKAMNPGEETLFIEPEPIKSATQHAGRTDASQSSAPTQPIHSEDFPGYWNCETWTRYIKEKPIVQESNSELKRSLDEFFPEASPQDRKLVKESQQNVLQIMKEVREAHDARYSAKGAENDQNLVDKFKARCEKASEIAYQYSQILDVMVSQAPEYVSLVYGAVKILLVVQVNKQEMKENVDKYMRKIKDRFDNISHLTLYLPVKKLVDAVATLYYYFQSFLAKAVKFYTGNRLKNYLKAIAKPWKELEPLVQAIDETYINIKDILNSHGHFLNHQNHNITQKNAVVLEDISRETQNNANLLHKLHEMVETFTIKMPGKQDVMEMADMLNQRLTEKSQTLTTETEEGPEDHSIGELEDDDVTRLIKNIFLELQDFEEESNLRRRVIETLPEMRSHRSKESNRERIDQILKWLESDVSELLWVDGNNLLGRFDFNSCFTVPLLISGDQDYTNTIVLRHSCGESKSASTCQALTQSLVMQLFKLRRKILSSKISCLTRDISQDIQKLWDFLVECVVEVKVECLFIIIDSVDQLRSVNGSENHDDKLYLLNQLDTLVKMRLPIVKILLTAHLTPDFTDNHGQVTSLVTSRSSTTGELSLQHNTEKATPLRLSLDPTCTENSLMQHVYVRLQDRQVTAIRFEHLSLIYPPGATVYTTIDGQLRAFIISKLAGMEVQDLSTYSPLVMQVWYIDHNGKYIVKRFKDLIVRQFWGERQVSDLTYIPAYHYQQQENRQRLIERGSRYQKLSRGFHHMQCMLENKRQLVMVDQCLAPKESSPLEDLDSQVHIDLPHNLKHFALSTCSPYLQVFVISQGEWATVIIDDLKDTKDYPSYLTMENLSISDDDKAYLSTILAPYKLRNTFQDPYLTRVSTSAHDERIQLVFSGPPGSMKKSTAYTFAKFLNRPVLFSRYEDTPTFLEYKLQENIRLARSWNAVLVIDDVDVIMNRLSFFENFRGLISITTTQSIVRPYDFYRCKVTGVVLFSLLDRLQIKRIFMAILHEFEDDGLVSIRWKDMDNLVYDVPNGPAYPPLSVHQIRHIAYLALYLVKIGHVADSYDTEGHPDGGGQLLLGSRHLEEAITTFAEGFGTSQ